MDIGQFKFETNLKLCRALLLIAVKMPVAHIATNRVGRCKTLQQCKKMQ